MKCKKCSAELPVQAQFCLQCGAPVLPGRESSPSINYAKSAASPTRTGIKPGILAAIVLASIAVLAAGYFGWKNLAARGAKATGNSQVTELQGKPLNGGPLTETGGRLSSGGPVTDSGSTAPAPGQPTDVIDYLKFIKEMEVRRLALQSKEKAEVLTWGSRVQAENWQGEMSDDADTAHKTTYNNFQQDMARWQTDWQQLNHDFLYGYTKPVPAMCAALRDKYYDALSKTGNAMMTIATTFSDAMSGDANNAMNALTQMEGSTTRPSGIDDSFNKADAELAAVCSKCNIHKDFDIKPEGGGSPLFGM